MMIFILALSFFKIANAQKEAQSVVIRTAYNRVREGKKDKEILALLRAMPQGRLDSWLTLSALKRAHALHRANPDKTVIFGGKHNLQLRAAGKITSAQWKAKRLLPLYFEGHAKSYGEQGGNHRFVLDIEHNTVWFYPQAKVGCRCKSSSGKGLIIGSCWRRCSSAAPGAVTFRSRYP